MSNQPFFSIVIPTYNRERTVLRSIQSVLNQTFSDLEVLVIDDGSTDGTNQKIKKEISDARVKYIYQENAERSAARNNGISQSKGKFICFLDSDDQYSPDHLEQFHRTLKTNEFKDALYYCDGILRVEGETDRPIFSPVQDSNDDRSAVEYIASSAPIGTVFTCIPSTLFIKERFDTNLRVGEDRELWARLAAFVPLRHSAHHSVIVHEHIGRTVHAANYASAKESVESLKVLLKKAGKKIRVRWRKKAMAAAYYGLAQSYAHAGFKYRGAVYAIRSILLFRDQYTTSIIVFVFRTLGLERILPNHLRSGQ